jgi:nucleotide-binding universal stress UspA family protein
MKILLAVDGSAHTIKAVDYLADHFDWFDTPPELHVLHVQPSLPISEGHIAAMVGQEAIESYYKEESEAALAPAEESLKKHGIPFQASYEVGDIAQKIHAYICQHSIDLLVMGTHGRGAFRNLVMGSIATKVLAITSVPVLLIR